MRQRNVRNVDIQVPIVDPTYVREIARKGFPAAYDAAFAHEPTDVQDEVWDVLNEAQEQTAYRVAKSYFSQERLERLPERTLQQLMKGEVPAISEDGNGGFDVNLRKLRALTSSSDGLQTLMTGFNQAVSKEAAPYERAMNYIQR